jgi:hypothetical protein
MVLPEDLLPGTLLPFLWAKEGILAYFHLLGLFGGVALL